MRAPSQRSADEIAKAEALALRISDKVDDILNPLEREMRIMAWPAEFQAIVWDALIARAIGYRQGHRKANPENPTSRRQGQ